MIRATDISKHRAIGAIARFALLLAAAWLAAMPGIARADTAKEYQIKAACLLNFAQFIEWPPSSFADAGTPITIGVLGDDPFGQALEQTFQDESVKGRNIVVKRSRQIEDLKACHLVFISTSEKDHLSETLTTLNDAHVVTIGDMHGFASRGGIVNFYLENNKVRFEINADAAQRSGLKISSQLLKRAKIVNSDSGKGRE
jgi:hypothetical protein